jgi:hypothetical protein
MYICYTNTYTVVHFDNSVKITMIGDFFKCTTVYVSETPAN